MYRNNTGCRVSSIFIGLQPRLIEALLDFFCQEALIISALFSSEASNFQTPKSRSVDLPIGPPAPKPLPLIPSSGSTRRSSVLWQRDERSVDAAGAAMHFFTPTNKTKVWGGRCDVYAWEARGGRASIDFWPSYKTLNRFWMNRP